MAVLGFPALALLLDEQTAEKTQRDEQDQVLKMNLGLGDKSLYVEQIFFFSFISFVCSH